MNKNQIKMSETVCYIGKVKVVAEGKEKAEEYAKKVCEDSDIKIDEYFIKYYNSSYIALLQSATDEYVFSKDKLYQIVENKEKDYNEIIYAEKTKEGANFVLLFHNGGAGFSECLEEALNKLE